MEEYGYGTAQQLRPLRHLARRLVEAGVSAVEINLGGWDTHNQNFHGPAPRACSPTLDQAMGTLVKRPGRPRPVAEHRAGVDGRVRPHPAHQPERRPRPLGRAAGRSWSAAAPSAAARPTARPTPTAWTCADNPVRVGDVFATIYRGLGIDPTTQVRDAIGRPFAIAGGNGRPIDALFS